MSIQLTPSGNEGDTGSLLLGSIRVSAEPSVPPDERRPSPQTMEPSLLPGVQLIERCPSWALTQPSLVSPSTMDGLHQPRPCLLPLPLPLALRHLALLLPALRHLALLPPALRHLALTSHPIMVVAAQTMAAVEAQTMVVVVARTMAAAAVAPTMVAVAGVACK